MYQLYPFRPSQSTFPNFYCKYASVHRVYDKGNDLVCELIDNTPLIGGRKWVTVDVKVQHLELNETTCIAGWHCDTITDPDAMHHLFIIGENRTEFKLGDNVERIPHNHFVSYGSDVEHRGPKTTNKEIRLLCRVTESNIVRGNSIFKNQYPHRFPIK